MKKLQIILLTIFFLFLMGCVQTKTQQELENAIKVKEITKEREHSFFYQYDGKRMILNGSLTIENSDYPVLMYFTNETAVLVRGEQCIFFDEPKILFGFIPPFWINHFDATVSLNESVALQYMVTDRSVSEVIFTGSELKKDFISNEQVALYENKKCITEEEYVLNA